MWVCHLHQYFVGTRIFRGGLPVDQPGLRIQGHAIRAAYQGVGEVIAIGVVGLNVVDILAAGENLAGEAPVTHGVLGIVIKTELPGQEGIVL